MTQSSEFRAGDRVRVKSKAEILKTLDESGQLEGLPFMPEMSEFCEKEFRVFKRSHKTCDPPNGLGGRRMLHAVHLEELRCNGSGHGACQARCLLFWKDAWLEMVGETRRGSVLVQGVSGQPGCTEEGVYAGTERRFNGASLEPPVFVCQSTQISQATQPLSPWDFRQYVEDFSSRNVSLSGLVRIFALFLYARLVSAGLGLRTPLSLLYDVFQRIRGGTPYPFQSGMIPKGEKTPSAKLDVQVGEVVKIRDYREVLTTINEDGHNRGMSFDAEMVPYCGKSYRVLDRITRIIDEKSGKMQNLKNDCIMLDKVVCLARCSKYRRLCPRSIYPYWREIWLERSSSDLVGHE
jgi:hypothetical protein